MNVRPIAHRVVYCNYDVAHLVGEGGFGQVFYARKINGNEVGKEFALKRMRINGLRYGEMESAQDEVENMVAVAGILETLKLHAVYVTGLEVEVVMEWAAGGSVRDAMYGAGGGRMTERNCRVALLGPLIALASMHKKGYVHFDVKPGNEMLRGALKEG